MREERFAVRGSAITSHRRASRRWAGGRVCEADGCSTRLSVYNGTARCWQHESLHPDPRPGGAPAHPARDRAWAV